MCPHCNTKCSFFGVGAERQFVLFCNSCGNGVFFKLNEDCIIHYDPQRVIQVDVSTIIDCYPKMVLNVNPKIPKEVADDFYEAAKCEKVSADRATVAMCRRAMQSTCILKGASANADLIYQIDELEQKRIINPTLKDMAHTIRMIGNWGAHPQNDPLRDVKSEDATEVLRFTEELLDEVFVRPERIKELKIRKGIK